ncbi:MAG: endonuclease MutS2 [Saprospiraceae bacterium]|nr:endonuclease MutS2 [Saprospiraceae bacterium]
MLLYPKDIFEKLEFSRILQLVSEECQGAGGKLFFSVIQIQTEKEVVDRLLDEVDEYKKCIERASIIPSSAYEEIQNDLFLLSKEGYVLEVESIQRIQKVLSIATQINHHFQDYGIQKLAPNLSKLALAIQINPALVKEIERIFDTEGNIRPNASEQLSKISKAIQNKERETEKVFRQEVQLYKEKGYLTEGFETIRNSRSVLMAAAEYKRKIAGIIHDESATGKTVFIEPEKTLALNNEVQNLYAERRSEIYKIVRDLCNLLRPFGAEIEEAYRQVVYFDVIRAKARFAIRIGAGRPAVSTKAGFYFKEARNPLLYLRQNEAGRETVAFDLELSKVNRFLILSGPNAGGKSVALKTIGLLHLMVQSGMLISADENSRMGIFHQFFVDIGDQQSIDDDLSTYSSHLTNMKAIIDHADEKTLILIDEFGSGTDPKIGGGIAEAVLKKLQGLKCFGAVTTHYSNLKYFAFKNHGFLNGSMEFDKKGLLPTYQLMVGKPGSSFAFEIAEKTGLPEDVLDYAKKRAGKHEQSMEEMLVNLQAERQEFEKKMTLVLEKEERLDRLMKTYDQLHGELEFRRKKLKLEQKEVALYQSSTMQKELQKMVKDFKNINDIEGARKKLDEQKLKKPADHRGSFYH